MGLGLESKPHSCRGIKNGFSIPPASFGGRHKPIGYTGEYEMYYALLVDNTEGNEIYSKFQSLNSKLVVDLETSFDRALSKVGKKKYDIVVVSSGDGKTDMLDLAEGIKFSKASKHADVILVDRHPTSSAKFVGLLRGRRVIKYSPNQITELVSLVERMLP